MSNPVLRLVVFLAGSIVLATVASCSPKNATEPAVSAPAAAISKDASVIDLMRNPIAPAADALWAAVGSESTAEGTRDIVPGTDAEWEALRQQAQLLIDAARALGEENRVVAHPGQKLTDPPGEGDLSPEQAQEQISRDRPAYQALATVMQGVGGDYLAAIESRSAGAFIDLGDKLNEVCETCHARYWYPKAVVPPAP